MKKFSDWMTEKDRGIVESGGNVAGMRKRDDFLQPGDTVSYYPDGLVSAGLRYATILDVDYQYDDYDNETIDNETMLKLKDQDGTIHQMSISELNPESTPKNIGPRRRVPEF